MKLGVVWLPNVGKSTLFNAITKAGAQAANYPFCTIEPNTGVVSVPDERLDTLAKMYSPKKVSLEFLLGGQEENVIISGIFVYRFWARETKKGGNIRETFQPKRGNNPQDMM